MRATRAGLAECCSTVVVYLVLCLVRTVFTYRLCSVAAEGRNEGPRYFRGKNAGRGDLLVLPLFHEFDAVVDDGGAGGRAGGGGVRFLLGGVMRWRS